VLHSFSNRGKKGKAKIERNKKEEKTLRGKKRDIREARQIPRKRGERSARLNQFAKRRVWIITRGGGGGERCYLRKGGLLTSGKVEKREG